MGKSYIAAMLCKRVWAKYRVSSYCVTAADMKAAWIKSIPAHEGSSEWMADRMETVRFLVLDDLGKEYRADSGFTETHLEQLLRRRIRSGLATCITANTDLRTFGKTYGESTAQLIQEAMTPIHLTGSNMRGAEAAKIKTFLDTE